MNSFRIATFAGQAVCSVVFSFGMVYALTMGGKIKEGDRLYISGIMFVLWSMIFFLRRQWIEWKEAAEEARQLAVEAQRELGDTTDEANDMMRIGVLARHDADFWRDGIEDLLKELHQDGIIQDPEGTLEELRLQCSVFLGDVSEAMAKELEKTTMEDAETEEDRDAVRRVIKKLFHRE